MVGDAASNRPRIQSGSYPGDGTVGAQSGFSTVPLQYLDTPDTTSAVTYTVQAARTSSSGEVWINRSVVDRDTSLYDGREASNIIAVEVGVSAADGSAVYPSLVKVSPVDATTSDVNWHNAYSGVGGDIVPYGRTLYVSGDGTHPPIETSVHEFTVPVVLQAGTWTVRVMHVRASNAGILDVYMDGTKIGTIDCYTSGSGVNDSTDDITGVVVASTAEHVLKCRVDSTSSGYYNCHVPVVVFIKTA